MGRYFCCRRYYSLIVYDVVEVIGMPGGETPLNATDILIVYIPTGIRLGSIGNGWCSHFEGTQDGHDFYGDGSQIGKVATGR